MLSKPSITLLDFLMYLAYASMFMIYARGQVAKYIQKKPYYKYYSQGMALKMLGAFLICAIYIYRYKGGDTLAYYIGQVAMINLLFENPVAFFKILLGPLDQDLIWSSFNSRTDRPPTWMTRKMENFFVIKVATVFGLFAFKNFLATSVIFAGISYIFIWRLYELFCKFFPNLYKQIAIGFLFLPSYWFWGSGILKDTICVAAICATVVYFHRIFLDKDKSFAAIIYFLLSIFVLFTVKKYLVIAIAPGLVIWASFGSIQKIQNPFLKAGLLPILLVGGFVTLLTVYSRLGDSLGVYSADNILEYATVVQQDLIREEAYGSNSFNIGTYEASTAGILSKAPAAIVAGLFRPFVWEAANIVMLFSALENLFLLFATIYFLIRLRIIYLFINTFKDPILLLCVTFSIILAMMIGLTSANFGALVRYKIPLIPFYFTYLSILYGILRESKNKAITSDYIPDAVSNEKIDSENKIPEFKLPKKFRNMYP